MVGVPHSKGCSLCRERRIRCDQSLPHCIQCRKYGVACPGYKRPWQFQDEGPRLQRRYQKCSITNNNNVQHDPDEIRRRGSVRSQVVANVSIDERVYPALIHQCFISQQPRMFKDFVCAAFPTMFFHNEFRFGDGFTFPDYVLKHFGSKPYYDACVSCLSAQYLAHLTGDPTIDHFSRQKYSQALRAVRQVLNSDGEASSDTLLLAVIVLAFYEMSTRTTRDAWVCHSRAVKHIMMKRGKDLHLSGAGRVCHFAFRPFLIGAAIYEGESCFLGDDEWQDLAAVLRAKDSRKKSEWSFYIDVYESIFMELVKCPQYIQEAREITSFTSPEALLLERRISMACDRLRTFNDELRSMLASSNQRKLGILYRGFIGPEPTEFPETSPSLLLSASVNTLSILEQLLARWYMPVYIRETPPSLGCVSPPSSLHKGLHSTDSSNASGPCLDFRLVCELGEGIQKDDPRAFTWLDRVAGSMGLLGAKAIY